MPGRPGQKKEAGQGRRGTRLNALTVDLEPWHVAELVGRHVGPVQDDQIEESLGPLLELLDRYDTRATFLVLGRVARDYPELVRGLHLRGHEIGCHGLTHRRLHLLGRKGFEEEIRECVRLQEEITGTRPKGFSAPTFSLDRSTAWALEVLKEYGFRYDASIFPIRTPLYGAPHAPLAPYRVSLRDPSREDPDSDLIEFPKTVLRLGVNIPISGGFYLRVLPLWFLTAALRQVNRTRPGIIYIHPWETYKGTPRPRGIPLFSRFVTYYGIGSALAKLEGLLREFRFGPAAEVLGV